MSHPRGKAESRLKFRILEILSFEQREQLSLRDKWNVIRKNKLCQYLRLSVMTVQK